MKTHSSRDSLVVIVTARGLDGPGFDSSRNKILCVFQNVQTGSEAHTLSYSVGTVGEATETLSWSLTFT